MKRPDIDTDPHSPQALRGGTNPGLGLPLLPDEAPEESVQIRMPPPPSLPSLPRREETTHPAPAADPNNSIDELLEGISRQSRTPPPGEVTSRPLVLVHRVSESSRPPPPPSLATSRRRIDTTTVPSARAHKASMVRGTWLTLLVVLAILGAAFLWRRHARSSDEAANEASASAKASAALSAPPSPPTMRVERAMAVPAPAAEETSAPTAVAAPAPPSAAPPVRHEARPQAAPLRPSAPKAADPTGRNVSSPNVGDDLSPGPDAPAKAPPAPPARDLELLGGTH